MKSLGSLLLLAGGFAAGSFAMGRWDGVISHATHEESAPAGMDLRVAGTETAALQSTAPVERIVYVSDPAPVRERVVYVEAPATRSSSTGGLRAHTGVPEGDSLPADAPQRAFRYDDNRDSGSDGRIASAGDEIRAERASFEAPEPARRIEVPAGTIIESELESTLSSRTASVGDRVRARVARDVRQAGEVILPEGAVLLGVVQESRAAGRVKGNGHLSLAFNEIVLPDGRASAFSGFWEQTADGKHKRDAAIIGGSTAGGALLGQIIGRDSESTVGGAVLGGAIGSGVVLSNKGRELDLEPGFRLVFETRSPTVLPVS